jgi:hypothetical protein
VPSVLIPFTGACAHRRAALAWVRARYAQKHPEWQVRSQADLGSSASNGRTEAGFCKAALVKSLIEASDAEIVIVADADVWCEGLSEAVEAVQGSAMWAMPHHNLHRLTREATEAVLAGADPFTAESEKPYKAMIGGGMVVLRRDVALAVPLDPRFIGWGGEDQAWGLALRRLYGPPWRGTEPMVHLWHPRQWRRTEMGGSWANEELRSRYVAALLSETGMRELLDEIKEAEVGSTA